MKYGEVSKSDLQRELDDLFVRYNEFKEKKLSLNMARGIPSKEQLDMVMGLLDEVNGKTDFSLYSADYRNYGMLDGIPEAKRLMGELLGVSESEVAIGGTASLQLMYDAVSRAFVFGLDGNQPWSEQTVKFLCPSPGYDRHFAITEQFGFELITIPMKEDGPDMDMVEQYVESDNSVKGIWCVPKYSNPDGITYSDEVVRRFASLKPMAADFRIFWDNAYAVHDIFGEGDELLNLMDECKSQGTQDMLYMFASTSKISFPGGGICCVAASEKNIKEINERMFYQIISYDKINQLRHARYFKDLNGIKETMKKHAEILRPKFEMVLNTLDDISDIARWHRPNGGYFISLFVEPGCAKRTVELCGEGGVILTGAGATYPYGMDPDDSNIRIAPTSPPNDELRLASELLVLCARIATVEKYLSL